MRHPSRPRLAWSIAAGVLLIALIVVLIAIVAGRSETATASSAATDFGVDVPDLGGTAVGDGVTWQDMSGRFSASGGAAAVAHDDAASTEVPTMAVVDLGQPAARVTARLDPASEGAGIVFRYVDDRNYWTLVAAPAYATWNLNKVVNGKTTFVANTGTSYVRGSVELSVDLDDATIRVSVAGREPLRLADAAGVRGHGAGLIAPSVDLDSRWDDFAVLGAA